MVGVIVIIVIIVLSVVLTKKESQSSIAKDKGENTITSTSGQHDIWTSGL